MWKIVHIKRLVLVSPEILSAGAFVVAYLYQPHWFEAASAKLESAEGLSGFAGALPLTLIPASWALGVSVLRPGDESENRILYEWPMYWALEVRVYGAVAVSVIGFCLYWLAYVNPFSWAPAESALISIIALAVPAVSVATLALAKMQVRKLLTLYS